MVKDLIHDPIFLARKSLPATKEDLPTAQDLPVWLRCVLRLCT